LPCAPWPAAVLHQEAMAPGGGLWLDERRDFSA
jgi:hypothetical protein